MSTRIQLRRGTAATWTSVNPVLAQGEPGLETDTGLRKIGDGVKAWTALTYDAPLAPSVVSVSSQSDPPLPLRLTVGKTAPSSPSISDLWLSTSWADARVAPGVADHSLILTPTGVWETGGGGIMGEPFVYIDNSGNWNLIYAAGTSPRGWGWATCPGSSDPTVAANWTRYGSNPFLSNTTPSLPATPYGYHAGVIYTGGTLYFYYPEAAANRIWVGSGPDPAHLTWQGTAAFAVQTDANSNPVSAISPKIQQRLDGSWSMMFQYVDAQKGSIQYSAGLATSSSLLGPFTIPTGGAPLLTLDPVTGSGGTDGPKGRLEGSTYVGWYHSAAIDNNQPTDIWRATSTDQKTWKILDGGLPVIQRADSYDGDQVAGVNLVPGPNGLDYAFWTTGNNNLNATPFGIVVAPLSPVLKRYDGVAWRPVLAQSKNAYLHGLGGNESFGATALLSVRPSAQASQGTSNSAFGYRTLMNTTTGLNNSGFGSGALQANVTSSNNCAFGTQALTNNTASFINAFGSQALTANTSGTGLCAFGFQALLSNQTGTQNCAFGNTALANNVSGGSNSAFGHNAGTGLTGSSNCAFGFNALNASSSASGSSAFGYRALQLSTTGGSSAFGFQALSNATTAISNSAFGNIALQSATGNGNSAFGDQALKSLTTGADNTAIGALAGVTQTSANATVTGGSNTFVGWQSGCGSTGDFGSMTAIGTRAIGTGNYATALGYTATAGASGAVAIGTDHVGTGASTSTQDEIKLGTSNHTVNIPTTSAVGNGASTNLTALAKNTGGGPASDAVNAWIPIRNGATSGFIPFFV